MSRCLIYKVHTAHRGGLLSYHTLKSLSRTFFKFFQTFFVPHSNLRCAAVATVPHFNTLSSVCQEPFSSFFKLFSSPHSNPRCGALLSQRFHILTRSPAFVKNFFQVFSNFFRPCRFGVPRPFTLATVSYVTTPFPLCQELFSTFFKVFSFPLRPLAFFCLPRTASIGYHFFPPLSSAFGKNF